MNKKSIKINFIDFWEGFNPKDNFFTRILEKEYNVIISDKPDYLFYSVFPKQEVKKGTTKKGDLTRKISPLLYIILRKIYSKLKGKKELELKFPKGDYVKIFYASEHVKPKMDQCDWAFSSYFEEEINHPNYMRIPMYKMTDYEVDKKYSLVKGKMDFDKTKNEKQKFCNFVYSQEIYGRNKFFKKLNKYKRVDAPGRCMNNMNPIGHNDAKKSRASKNWVSEKLDFLKKYKFTIAYENFSSPGWVTEKLTHPMKVNSIPIYIGHKSVSRDFNTKSFINRNDFKTDNEFIKYIIRVDNDDNLYRKILSEPWLKENRENPSISDKLILKRLKEIIESKK